jgi:hypothetical protein
MFHLRSYFSRCGAASPVPGRQLCMLPKVWHAMACVSCSYISFLLPASICLLPGLRRPACCVCLTHFLERLCVQSDIVSLHCPLMPSTFHIINAERWGGCRNGGYSTGPCVWGRNTYTIVLWLGQ